MAEMTSLERTMAAISHKEGDRVPLFLLLSLYGAKELNMSVKDYFSNPENVVKAQLLMKEKYHNDCLYTFFYAPIEIEAFGGEVVFIDEGPPNSGRPLIGCLEDIDRLTVPDIDDCPCLQRVLEATRRLKAAVGDETPIVGVVMSPFSLPVMQMGFGSYIEMIYGNRDYFDKLIAVNEAFCVAWANAQLKAGATAICYFDPLASPTIIERETYLKTGHPVASRTLGQINGPTATHLASGIALSVVDDVAKTGTAIIGFSAEDDLEAIKKATAGKLCLLGNLNGIDMIRWDLDRVEAEVKRLIEQAGQGGGLIISDNHGEIPWQMPEAVLMKITETVKKFGTYPIGNEAIHE